MRWRQRWGKVEHMKTTTQRQVSRRGALRAIGLGLLSIPVLQACASIDTAGPDATPSPDATPGSSGAWASGGTAAMTAKSSYPDPFAVAATTCPLVMCQTTAGPCTTTNAAAREDVSEGLPGLPVRLALRFVTSTTCVPIAGAVIEIWHTQATGVYSGATPNPQMCNGADADAHNHDYFRGTQTTDAQGRASFDTCFPGWYSGRAIHIHFRVTVGGTSQVVSQLFFAQALIQDVFATHVDYKAHGQPNTPNASDMIYGGTVYELDTARMTDGAMLASKTIAVHGAAQQNCSA